MDAIDRGGAEAASTASTGVPALDLGARLRAERLRQGMSLREMARRLGVSASALSQIETGKAQPSVSKLFDIVNLLNTSLDGLLAGAPAQRAGAHEALELESGVHWRRLTAGSFPGVEFLHVTYAPGGCSSREGTFMRHAGQEFGVVQSGRLVVDVGCDSYELCADDSIIFPSTSPHRLGNP